MLENKIKEYNYACDCVALARKVNCILELNITNPIQTIAYQVRFALFPFNIFFSSKKKQRDKKCIQWLNVYSVRRM